MVMAGKVPVPFFSSEFFCGAATRGDSSRLSGRCVSFHLRGRTAYSAAELFAHRRVHVNFEQRGASSIYYKFHKQGGDPLPRPHPNESRVERRDLEQSDHEQDCNI